MPSEATYLATIALIGLTTGTLIGTTGIGGILLAPLLSYLLGIDLHVAMSSSSLSFLFTGIMGTALYARSGSIAWGKVGWLSLGIIPAAILGARTNSLLSTATLTTVLAILIVLSGLNALFNRSRADSTMPHLAGRWLVLIGLAVGFGSALTGTGGPVLLMPILVAISVPALAAIGISQAIQLPLAIFATIGFTLYGQIDLRLGLTLGIVQAVGVVIGAGIAHSLPAAQLGRVVAITLIGVGILMLGQAIF